MSGVRVDITVPKLSPLADRLLRVAAGIAAADLFPGQQVVSETATTRTIRVKLPAGVGVGHTLRSGPLELLSDDGGRIRVSVPAGWAPFLRMVGTPEIRGNAARIWVEPGWTPFRVPLADGYWLGFAPVV